MLLEDADEKASNNEHGKKWMEGPQILSAGLPTRFFCMKNVVLCGCVISSISNNAWNDKHLLVLVIGNFWQAFKRFLNNP